MISVLVRTLNEEDNLPSCLASLGWCQDVVVLDANSQDSTVQIARQWGAQVVVQEFGNESEQFNWAFSQIGFKHDWVYICDADEVVTPELAEEMLAVIAASPVHGGYSLRYKNFFCGTWLRRCGIYPVWLVRLVRKDAVQWEREINTRIKVEGSIGRLAKHFHHFSFARGLEHWLSKHNRYSSAEAREAVKYLGAPWDAATTFRRLKEREYRRQQLKEIAWRLPARPLLRFLYMYIFRLGFLDGAPGLHYCLLLTIYEYLIQIKAREIAHPPFGR